MGSPEKAESGSENPREKLKSQLLLLRTESGILDRVVHKGKNQHRRCSYFQHLLKVRRDVRLLLSAGVEEVLGSMIGIVDGKKPVQKFHLLERLKKKYAGGNYNHHERLLGIARLLSQMTEPIMMAAIEMSSLLARSFFMGYSLMILALLARVRVLVQQILLDVVSIYNMVSDASQEKHSVKLKEDGVEVFREYFPRCGDAITLECVWEKDKYVLHERAHRRKMNQDEHASEVATLSGVLPIVYETLEISDEGHEPSPEQVVPPECSIKELAVKSDATIASDNVTNMHFLSPCNMKSNCENKQLSSEEGSPSAKLIPKIKLLAKMDSTENAKERNTPSNNSKKVAFIQIRKSSPAEADKNRLHKKARVD